MQNVVFFQTLNTGWHRPKNEGNVGSHGMFLGLHYPQNPRKSPQTKQKQNMVFFGLFSW